MLDNNSLWLWVPAFAGTHNHRELLSSKRRLPDHLTTTAAEYGSLHYYCCGVWVPAFAGTTNGKIATHPVSAAFTRPLALPKSICPAYFVFSTAITLPMSFMPAAPVSAMAALIAAVTSASDICFGR